MNTRRFFSDRPVINRTIAVTGEEYYHLKTVNRARVGDSLEIIDGAGAFYFGKILKLGRDEAVVIIEQESKQEKPPLKIVIAPSLTKKKGMGLMIEKLTEMGVDEIRPVIFSRTDEVYSASQLKKWQRVAVQSLKVNKKLWATEIYPPVTPDKLLVFSRSLPLQSRVLLDASGPDGTGRNVLSPVLAVIGPPGDYTQEERQLFIGEGLIPLKISDCILKTETAAIAAASIFSLPGRV